MAQTSDIQSIRIGDRNAHCCNIIRSSNTACSKNDEGDLVMHWLSPPDPNNPHKGVDAARFDLVGDLFLVMREL